VLKAYRIGGYMNREIDDRLLLICGTLFSMLECVLLYDLIKILLIKGFGG